MGSSKRACTRLSVIYPFPIFQLAAGSNLRFFYSEHSMVTIQLSNISLVLGSRTIFSDLNWEIQHDQVIGLIGPNGAGKSSILKLITGEYFAEPGGSITRAKGTTIGYLPQEPRFETDVTALEFALSAVPRIDEIENKLNRIEVRLAAPEVYNDPKKLSETLDLQQQLIDEFVALGGDTFGARVKQMLIGLGLPEYDLNKPLQSLSGGQKKLVGLGRLLLTGPDVLLLDEADNHLDLPGKDFLENMVRTYSGAIILISHDRYLLDASVTHIAELESGRMTIYEGDFSSYMIEKDLRLARQETLYQAQKKEFARMNASIKRLALWGKLYDNAKFSRRAEAMQKRLERIEAIEKPEKEYKRMDLQLNGWRGSTKVLALRSISKSFSNQQLFNNVNHTILHGERVGLIGPNGSGKSVLLRMILGLENQDEGEIIIGPSVKVGYYAQEHETLNPNQSLIEAVRQTAPLSEDRAVAFLLRYLFSYQQASNQIKELSGGERSRLQLALLVLSGANLLLLDEPTNNLDIASAEVLEEALTEFEGTTLIISHDRYFLDRTVSRILFTGDGNLTPFEGNFTDFLGRDQPME
jgi:ATP-binding cassette subfamily F protein 3